VISRAAERGDGAARFGECPLGRAGDACELAGLDSALGEPGAAPVDEQQVLRDAVVQVAGQAPALIEDGSRGELILVAANLPRYAREERKRGRDAEDVTRGDPLRVQRRERDVVDTCQQGQPHGRHDPPEQRVALA
jgi:hypothetical protein